MKTAVFRREQGFRLRSGFGLQEAELAARFRLPQSPRLMPGRAAFREHRCKKKIFYRQGFWT
jgi:hypothetical protein